MDDSAVMAIQVSIAGTAKKMRGEQTASSPMGSGTFMQGFE